MITFARLAMLFTAISFWHDAKTVEAMISLVIYWLIVLHGDLLALKKNTDRTC